MAGTTRTVGAKVVLDGEKEYKQALQELNAGNRTLATEMKKLQAEYKGQTNSTEYLAKAGELLERKLLQQKDKVATLRDAVKELAQKYGESDSRTQEWIQKLNLAEAAEFDLQHAITDNNKALEDAQNAAEEAAQAQHDLEVSAGYTGEALVDESGAMKGLGDVVGDLTQKLGIHLPQGATNALNGMSMLSSGTVAAMGVAAAAIAAVVKTVKTLQEETIAAAARADEILSRSTQMNISAQQYQALQYASPFVDVDVDTLAGSLQKITQAMGQVAAGSDEAREKFESLGISITNADGSLRDSYDVWLDTMDALAGITNETERDIAAQELLGKSASDLATIYREGTGALREYTEAASDNYIMSDEQLEALGRVDDAVQHLHLTQEANKNMIAAEWAPTAEKALKSFDRLVTAAGKALVDSGIIQGFGELVEYALALLDPISSLLESADGAPGRLQPVYEVLHGIAGVFAWIADMADVVTGLFSLDFTKVGTALGYGQSAGNLSHMQQWQQSGVQHRALANRDYYEANGFSYDSSTGLWSGNYGRNAGGTGGWRGGLTWVGEAGPELVDLSPGSRVLSAQDSRNAGGVVNNYNINVSNIDQLSTLLTWFDSLQVRKRMA